MSARPGVAQRSHRRPEPQRAANWMDEARCSGSGIDFHSEDSLTVLDALSVCDDCVVRTECLTHALQRNEPGVWGGTTAADREALTARRRAAL